MKSYRWIIVNDGSSILIDTAIAKLKESPLELKYIYYEVNKGKGYALRQGIQITEAPYIIFTDIDFPYRIESFFRLSQSLIDNESDVVYGVRNNTYYDSIPGQRKLISKTLKQLIKLLFNLPSADTQGGLKGFNERGRDIFLSTKTNRYLIDLEFLKKANRNKQIRLRTVPADLREGITLQPVSFQTIASEMGSFLRILIS